MVVCGKKSLSLNPNTVLQVLEIDNLTFQLPVIFISNVRLSMFTRARSHMHTHAAYFVFQFLQLCYFSLLFYI